MRVDLRKYIKQLPSQFGIDCCTSCAALLAMEMMSDRQIDLSRLYLYYMARKLAGRQRQSGVDLISTLESLKNGICTTAEWPYALDKVDIEPADISCNIRLAEYESVTNFKSYLDIHIPIIIGMFVTRQFWTQKGSLQEQADNIANSPNSVQFKGHAMTIVGYDDELANGSWIVANSLGLHWGDYGIGLIPYSFDIKEAYVLTSFIGLEPRRKISPN